MVGYTSQHSIRDHLFSSEHIENVKRFVKTQSDSDINPPSQAYLSDPPLRFNNDFFGTPPQQPYPPQQPSYPPQQPPYTPQQPSYPPLLANNTDLVPGLVAHELMAKLHRGIKTETDNGHFFVFFVFNFNLYSV